MYTRPFLRSYTFIPKRAIGGPGNAHQRGSRPHGTRTRAHQASLGSSTPQGWWTSPLVLPTAAAAIMGGSLALFFSKQQQPVPQRDESSTSTRNTISASSIKWVEDLAREDGAIKVLTAAALLAQDHPFLEDDHMFSAFVARGIINDIEGWYLPAQKKFSTIISLGREVAGFPRVVHGGLTAAMFDESFGGLLFSLKKSGGFKFWGPAYTVQLEVTYKSKIPAGATVLCCAEVESVEGRKIWMTATMSGAFKSVMSICSFSFVLFVVRAFVILKRC